MTDGPALDTVIDELKRRVDRYTGHGESSAPDVRICRCERVKADAYPCTYWNIHALDLVGDQRTAFSVVLTEIRSPMRATKK